MRRFLALFVLLFIFLEAVGAYGGPHGYVQVTATSKDAPVHYIITDPIGRRLGYDPRTDLSYNEFPGGYYNTESGKREFGWEAIFDPIKGDYTIEAVSSGLAAFTLALTNGDDAALGSSEAVVDKWSTARFVLSSLSDGKGPSYKIKRVVSPANLKQDISLFARMGWIVGESLIRNLVKRADETGYDLANGWKDIALHQVRSLKNELNARGPQEIRPEAAAVLMEDADGLEDQITKGH